MENEVTADANDAPPERPLSSGKVIWSGLLSLFMPGLGQVYARSWRRGATVLALDVAYGVPLRVLTGFRPEPGLVAVFLACLVGYILFTVWAAADAVSRARRAPQVPRPRWFYSAWVACLAMLAIGAGFNAILPSGWRNFSIPSGSMSPTLLVGDYIIVGSPKRSPPALGDVVVFRSPRNNSADYVKRIVGLPGDRIQMIQGQLVIDGQKCPREPLGYYDTGDGGYRQRERLYRETLPNGVQEEILKLTDGTDASRLPGFDPAKDFDPNNTVEYLVPRDHVFAMGDHRDNSVDSRFMNQIGFVPIENLAGRAETVYFSTDAEHPWYEIWWWRSDIRWNRLLRRIR